MKLINHWKLFPRRERNGAVILLSLIFVVNVSNLLIDYFAPPVKPSKELIKKVELAIERYNDSITAEKIRVELLSKKKIVESSLFLFNPNSISIDSLTELGIPSYLAKRIVNYREKGGNFKIKSDFKKMYGMHDSLYSALYEYIELPDSLEKKNYSTVNSHIQKDIHKRDSTQENSFKRKVKVDYSSVRVYLNKSDTLDFIKIRGIGPVFAKRIIEYREKLGGFYSKEQIKEVYGINDSLYAYIESNLVLDEDVLLKKLNINTLSAYELSKHPYINWKIAEIIVSNRGRKKKYKDKEELLKKGLLNEFLYAKIAPYLTVED